MQKTSGFRSDRRDSYVWHRTASSNEVIAKCLIQVVSYFYEKICGCFMMRKINIYRNIYFQFVLRYATPVSLYGWIMCLSNLPPITSAETLKEKPFFRRASTIELGFSSTHTCALWWLKNLFRVSNAFGGKWTFTCSWPKWQKIFLLSSMIKACSCW